MPADPWFNPNGYVAVPRAWQPDEQTLLTQMAAIRTSGYGATADPTGVAPFARGEAFRGMMVPPMQQMGDEMAAAATDHVDREMMRLYLEQIERSIAYFGVPARTVTTADVQTFENRFRPLIQTAHCTYSWLSQYVNEHMHQREKRWNRAPAEMLHMRGMFDDEHTAAEQRFSLDISRLAENARFNLFGPRPL